MRVRKRGRHWRSAGSVMLVLAVALMVMASPSSGEEEAFGPEWMIGFNITPVVPNFVDRWVKGM